MPLPTEVDSLDSPLSEPYTPELDMLQFEPESPFEGSEEHDEQFGEDQADYLPGLTNN